MKTWTDNPLVQPLVKEGKWPSLRTAIWMGFGLGLVMVAVISIALRQMPISIAIIDWLSLFGWPVLLVGPLVIGMVAGDSTVRILTSKAFDLVRLANLSEREIVRGLVGRTLYRTRILLALIVAALPVAVLGTIYFALETTDVVYSTYCVASITPDLHILYCEYLPTFGPPAAWLSLVVIVLGLWGMSGLAAALGTALGLSIKKGGATSAITVALILPLTLGWALPMVYILNLLIETSSWLFGGLPLNWDIFFSR